MKALFRGFLILSVVISNASGQSSKPLFLHFTPKNGLPSSQIYQVIQDNKGYIWFASDHGLAKYNGYEFKKYTSADGLLDNTVFKLFLDARDRVWMLTFSGRMFYMERDSIKSYKYNTLLSSVIKNSLPLNFHVDSLENVHVSCSRVGEYLLTKEGKVIPVFNLDPYGEVNKIFYDEMSDGNFVSSSNAAIDVHKPSFFYFRRGQAAFDSVLVGVENNGAFYACRLKDDRMLLSIANKLYELKNNALVFLYELPSVIYAINEAPDKKLWVATANGIYVFADSQNLRDETLLLENEFITSSLVDFEGGVWITTVNSGAYYLNDLRIKSFLFEGDSIKEPLCLGTDGTRVYAGFWEGGLAAIQKDKFELIHSFGRGIYITGIFADTSTGKLYLSKRTPGFMYAGRFQPLKNNQILSLKGRFLKHSNGDILNASINAIYRIKNDSLSIAIAVNKRTNCIFEYAGDSLLLGTNAGAFLYTGPDHLLTLIHPYFNDIRVDDISRCGDIICFATRGSGLLLLRNDTVVSLKAANGLCSNILHRLEVHNNEIWCSSYNGLSQVLIDDFAAKSFTIRNVSINEGLPDNEINDLLITHDTLWLATKNTVSYLNINERFVNDVPPLIHFTSLVLNNNRSAFSDSVRLKYKDNNISIGFEAISYKSNSRIIYRYMLIHEADTFLSTTSNRHVEFLSLEPGNYTFSVSAMNSTGVWTTAPITFQFVVLSPFWKQWWFYLLVALFTSSIVYLVMKLRIERVREQEALKADFNKQLLTLEMKALRAQMNPHFIFNVINSIQDYILKNDSKSAQKYLTKFARLVRLILDNSMEGEVLLSEELRANELYMELEQQRFEGKFDFILNVRPGTETEDILIPSMIIQPFLENAIKHGVQHLAQKGIIQLTVDQDDTQLIIEITDNGIGRDAAAKWKEQQVSEHVSRGSAITHKRVKAYNEAHNASIELEVEDLMDKEGQVSGTCVKLIIPLKFVK